MKTPLQKWMDERNLTDAELAARIGSVSRSQINRIRNGRPTRPGVALRLEAETGIPAIQFVTGIAA